MTEATDRIKVHAAVAPDRLPHRGLRYRLRVRVQRSGDAVEIVLRGELDDASAPQGRAAVDEALADPLTSLVLDLGGLQFMDSAGIWLIIETDRRCVEASVDLGLAGERQPAVTHALELAGVDALIREPLDCRAERLSDVLAGRGAAREVQPEQHSLAGAFESDRVVAPPTLIKVRPEPELRLIGSIADEDAILRYLGLRHLAA